MSEKAHLDPELLISYLYDECEAGERAHVAAHLDGCAACAAEIASLTATRQQLAGWAPPDVSLGFQLTRTAVGPVDAAVPASVLRPARWWSRPLPAWAQAAAAVLIFGAGLSVGMTRTGNAAPPQKANEEAAAVQTAVIPAPRQAGAGEPATGDQVRRELAALRSEIAAVRSASTAAPAVSRADRALMEQVRALIEESEQRQRIEFTARAAQLATDFDLQRRVDRAAFSESLGRVQDKTSAEVMRLYRGQEGLARVVGLTTTGR